MKNLITAHIKDTTWTCQAERETRAIAGADKMIKVTLLAVAALLVAATGLAFAKTLTGPNIPVAAFTHDNETVSLTVETHSKCEIGEYVAEKTSAADSQFGCWMQPNRSTVNVRWTTVNNGPEFVEHDAYSMSKFSQTQPGKRG